MLLCLDVGNTHIYGGLFIQDKLSFQFRYPTKSCCTSDELGIFLKAYLREIQISSEEIQQVVFCCVVPSLEYSLHSAFIKYFKKTPFVLERGVQTGLKIEYTNPGEVGADRIANAIAAAHFFPDKNIIIADLGTATTFEAITADKVFLGGAIIPGLQMQMRALHDQTASLPPVRIIKMHAVLGQSTSSNIQGGLYYGQLGAIREIIKDMTEKNFNGIEPLVVGTGGFSYLYESENIFHTIFPDLVLHGLRIAYIKNQAAL